MSIDPRLEDPSKLGPDGDPGATDPDDAFAFGYRVDEPGNDEPLRPLNWNLLTGEEAESDQTRPVHPAGGEKSNGARRSVSRETIQDAAGQECPAPQHTAK